MRKLSTRQHIIEDLGFNHIERQILKGGHIMHRYGHGDYGLDGEIVTFNTKGEIEKFVRIKIPITDTFTTTNFSSLLKNLKL